MLGFKTFLSKYGLQTGNITYVKLNPNINHSTDGTMFFVHQYIHITTWNSSTIAGFTSTPNICSKDSAEAVSEVILIFAQKIPLYFWKCCLSSQAMSRVIRKTKRLYEKISFLVGSCKCFENSQKKGTLC